jgi:hypothetical protein
MRAQQRARCLASQPISTQELRVFKEPRWSAPWRGGARDTNPFPHLPFITHRRAGAKGHGTRCRVIVGQRAQPGELSTAGWSSDSSLTPHWRVSPGLVLEIAARTWGTRPAKSVPRRNKKQVLRLGRAIFSASSLRMTEGRKSRSPARRCGRGMTNLNVLPPTLARDPTPSAGPAWDREKQRAGLECNRPAMRWRRATKPHRRR